MTTIQSDKATLLLQLATITDAALETFPDVRYLSGTILHSTLDAVQAKVFFGYKDEAFQVTFETERRAFEDKSEATVKFLRNRITEMLLTAPGVA